MAVFHENMLIGASGQGAAGPSQYQISRSLRFNSADSANLSRTFGTPTVNTVFTLSLWCKRSALGVEQRLFSVDTSYFRFTSADALQLSLTGGTVLSAAVFRDPSAWCHVVWTKNGTTNTVYVNNTQVATGTAGDTAFNGASKIHSISNATLGFSGYLAEVHFVDGQVLTPTNFAELDAATGTWIPKVYTGTYGNNGFKLTFSDNSGTTATTLGKDAAGSNNWTPNNFSVTAGVGNDSLVDTPTSYGTDTGVGGEVRGNYCVLSPVNNPAGETIANGGLDGSLDIANAGASRLAGTMAVSSGKWYWEVLVTNAGAGNLHIGVIPSSNYSNQNLAAITGALAYGSGGTFINNTSSSSYGATYINSDTIGVALDLDAGTLIFYKNGTSQGTAATGITGAYTPAMSDTSSGAWAFTVNFGQRPFTSTAPSGYKALCDTNMSAPVIAKPSTAFDIVTYTGTGASLTPTSSLGFSPDLVWIKGRSTASDNAIYDIVRGTTKDIVSNTNGIETTQAQGLTAFNSNGFTVGTLAKLNTNTATYVAWAWDAGSSTVTNTNGSLSSQVHANASAGIAALTYTGGVGTGTVGHGLGVAPSFIIVKNRLDANKDWGVWHSFLGAGNVLYLNTPSGIDNVAVFPALPSSTVFTVGQNSQIANNSGSSFVAYCFAPVAGFSSFNSYVGNNNANGPFVHTGFRPRWIMIKQTTALSTTNWVIVDAAREGYNVDNDPLWANLTTAEATTDLLDITSTGFKVRSLDTSVNASAGTYIYAAFAEAPFQYARAR